MYFYILTVRFSDPYLILRPLEGTGEKKCLLREPYCVIIEYMCLITNVFRNVLLCLH